ncbi:hydrolase of X-linked nucleoside pyrophosphate N-terminal domain protein [Streptococcus sp. oral taxon 056 str. F0418]|nr:hydrolase of X-linked nucleoside pyrophosphate N-terminal domain protein [Streptococcus sp. oral taxon 056 str. F0418]
METKEAAKTIQRLLSITETGLAFSRDEFDRERYLELRQLLGHLWLIGQIWMEKNWQSCCAQRIFMPLP